MALTGAERQERYRAKRKKEERLLQESLAIAARQTLRNQPVLLIEEMVEYAVEIAWLGHQAQTSASNKERDSFVSQILKQPSLADALKPFTPDETSADRPEFDTALACIRNVCEAAKICRSQRQRPLDRAYKFPGA